MAQYAKFETRSAWVGSEFGDSFARRLFGDAVVDALPRYVRGKSAGKPKAEIAWVKCVEGGWVKQGADVMRGESVGCVERRVGKVVLAVLRSTDTGEQIGEVYGDVQYLNRLSG